MNIQTRSILLAAAALAVTVSGCATSKNMAAAPTPAPIEAPEAAPTYVIQDVNFDFDKSNLKPRATDTLDHVASELRKSPELNYEVAGYTDSIGTDAYNQGLSERRAASVREYLIGRGVASERLGMTGHSESQPIANNSTAEGRAKNRRVEVRPVS